jgi:hypothetical protein
MSLSLIDRYQGFGKICWVHLLKVEATDSSTMFVPVYSHAVSLPRRGNLNRLRAFENSVAKSVTH